MGTIPEYQIEVIRRAKAAGVSYHDALEIAGVTVNDAVSTLEVYRIKAEEAQGEFDKLRQVLENN